jgi:DNA invertase Pin-like site-specific DNA recombinase
MRQPYRARIGPGVVVVRVAYLRSEGSEEDIQSAMAALEEVGCDRVVVDSSTGNRPESRTALQTFLNRMKPGDDLVVTRLDQLATSMPRLVEFLAAMMDRGIAVETIAGEIDTADPTVSQLIKSLWAFEQRARSGTRLPRRSGSVDASPGRPRRLANAEIEKAREMVDRGRPVAEVARELGVSRATLYRSLSRAA